MSSESPIVLWLPSILDRSIKEANSYSKELVRTVKNQIMSAVIQCEYLGFTTLKVFVILNNDLGTLI